MNTIHNMTFKRKFAINLYKNLKFTLSQMTFTSDFINGNNENMYPVLTVKGVVNEKVENNTYVLESNNASVSRLIGQHFPYATYRIKATKLDGEIGVIFSNKQATAKIVLNSNGILQAISPTRSDTFDTQKSFKDTVELLITSRRGKFDIYIKEDSIRYVTTFVIPCMQNTAFYDVFTSTSAGLILSGNVTVSEVEEYIDCGIAQADIRPIRYENGEVMIDSGKLYLTASIRMQEECYQGVFSWVPGTSEFELTGAIFYDTGDGMWGNDVAASLLYNRSEEEWFLWVCSFSHKHILGHARFEGDVRFGLNVVDITLMDEKDKDSGNEDFDAKSGDEDPDFIYDKSSGKWYMAICRHGNERKYRYYLYESSNPFKGYKHKSTTDGIDVTGGSFVRIGKELNFICGSNRENVAEYHIYPAENFESHTLMKCDYHDGGFRGWGTVIPVKLGARTRYFWLTFDRYRPSDYTWSYGNVYCFEADKFN